MTGTYGRRPLAAALLLCAALGACSASSPATSARPADASPAPSVAPVPTRNAAAELARAGRLMAAVHSYAFRTVVTLVGGAATPATVVTGRVIRPDTVAYTVASGSSTEQTVQLGSVAYVRTGHAPWRHVAARPTDPLLSLLALLRAFQPSTMTAADGGYVLRGRAPLRLVGKVPAGVSGATRVPVEVVINGAGWVTQVVVTEPAVAGTRRVTGRSTTSFSAFDRVGPITAPR